MIVESNYRPTAPASRFHSSDSKFIVLVGGLGSGKSFAVVKEIEQSCCQWENMKVAIYRKTMPALRDSTLTEFKEHSNPDLGKFIYREDEYRYPNGSFVRFRGLDEASKAKSTNYSMVILEEAEEFTFEEFKRLKERARQKGPWPVRVVLVLNPVDEDHWIYEQFIKNPKEWEDNGGLDVIHFSTFDNLDNLPEGYIEQVSAGLTESEKRRLLHGEWGTIVKGKVVYGDALNPMVHLRHIDYYPGMTLLRGWDFGFNRPATSFRLVDELGRMNTRFAMIGHKEHLQDFAPQVIAKTHALFPDIGTIFDFGDPRGHDNKDTKGTSFDILSDFGINARGERGSRDYVMEGIRQVRKELSTMIQGVPQLTIDPNCPHVRTAYFARYVMGDDGKPHKDGFYDHICDADRYISHHHRHTDAVLASINRAKSLRNLRTFSKNRYTGY